MKQQFRKVKRKPFSAPETWQQLDTAKLCRQAGIEEKLRKQGWFRYVRGIKTYVNPRITRTLAYANYERGTIELNQRYLARKDLRKKMLETFVHEVAHHLAHEYLKHAGHGRPWKEAMLWLGYEPERMGKI